MYELKTTQKESIGLFWRVIRPAGTIGMMASGFLFAYVGHLAGYLTAMGSALAMVLGDARVYVISNLQRIGVISTLRERLMMYGDNEYILESIKKDQIWRGEEVSPEITSKLSQYAQEREEFKARVMELANKIIAPTNDEKASN